MSADIQSADEIELARAQEYMLLSRLLLQSPDTEFLERLARLRGDGSELGRAHAALGDAASRYGAEAVAREHFVLFSGLGRGELLPYASYYLTGFVQGRPLADLRATLRRLEIVRAEGQSEPEDHAGILLEIMAGLVSGSLGAPVGSDREFFGTHLGPWVGRFFSDLERSPGAKFYASVGALGRTLMEIERLGFELLEPHA